MNPSPDRARSDRNAIEIKRLAWARDLNEATIQELAEVGEFLQFEPEEVVHRAHESMEFVYFILGGQLEVTVSDALGNDVLQRPLVRGSVLGLFSMALPDQSHTHVVATESTSAIRFGLQQFLGIVPRHADLQLSMYRLAANLVRQILVIDRTLAQPSVVGVVHQSEASRSLTHQLASRFRHLEPAPCVASDDVAWPSLDGVPFRLVVEHGRPIDVEQLQAQFGEWSAHGRIFVDLSAGNTEGVLVRMLNFADLVLWCVRPDDAKAARHILAPLLERTSAWRNKIRIVWLMDEDTQAAPYEPELRQLADRDFKISFRDTTRDRGSSLRHGIERIVHHLRGVRIGLALGGGAARGMAHLGVLKVLEQGGIYVDMLAGTSAGAMAGTLYASGMSTDFVVECFKNDLRLPWMFRHMPGGGYWYLVSKYRGNQFEPMLRRYLGDARLEQLTLPIFTVTVDLVEGVPVVRETGDATSAILESINLPGLSNPIVDSGRALVDGGLVNNIPADVLVSKGCNLVLASSVTAKLEQEFMGIRANETAPRFKLSSMFQVMMRGQMVQSFNMNSIGVQPADFVIEPDVTAFDLSAFGRADEMAAVGERAATEALPRIRELLFRLDAKLFPGP